MLYTQSIGLYYLYVCRALLNYMAIFFSFVILTTGCHSSSSPEMTDLEQTFLHTTINGVLPDLPEMTEDILEETLLSV